MSCLRMTAAEYRVFMAQNAARKPNKHRNKRVYVYADGFVANEKTDAHGDLLDTFDSVKEYERWKELQLLEKAGKISQLRKQVPLLLHPAFTGKDGKERRAVYYKADFVYNEGNEHVVEDVKGYDKRKDKYITTETFRLKWKLLQASYPDYQFRLY